MSEKRETMEELAKVVSAALASHHNGNGFFKYKSSKRKRKGKFCKQLDPNELEGRRDENL